MQRSSRSAFSSPERPMAPTNMAIQSHSAPSPPSFLIPPLPPNPSRGDSGPGRPGRNNEVKRRLDRDFTREGETLVQNVSNRARLIQKEIEQLQKDQKQLEGQIQESKYSDEHLAGNLKQIQELWNQVIEKVVQTSEAQGIAIWSQLNQEIAKSLELYKQHLKTCHGRKELLETKQCLAQLQKLLTKIASQASVPKAPSTPSTPSASFNQNRHVGQEQTVDKLICCICLDREVRCSVSCGHLMCAICSQSVDKCPVCRKNVLPADIRPIYF